MVNESNINNEFPPGMAPKMLNLLKSVEQLEETLNPIISKPHHEAFAKITSLDKSKLGMMEAYTINSLFWVLMKTSTEDVSETINEDYKIEMNRLKEVQSKIREIESRAQRPRTNVEAAARLIKRGIGKHSRVEDGTENASKTKHLREEKPDNCESETFKKAWQ